jgi:LPXTG-motif cell wall-anchored protein
MRRSRLATLAVSGVALLLTTAAVAPAGAASTGVGTSQASTSILDVALGTAGDALHLNLLSDKAQSSIDPKVSNPAKAVADLSPLRLTSKVIGALNGSVPGLHAESTGDEQKATTPAIPLNIGSFASGGSLISGTLNAPTLSALVDSNGAVGGITAGVNKFSVLSGLLTIPNATVNLGAKAQKSDASGLRGIAADSVDLVNVAAILRGLGIDPANLPLSTVTGLLDKLGLPLGFGGQSLSGTQITGLVGSLTTAITGLTGTAPIPAATATQLNGLLGTVTGTVGTLVGGTTPATGAGSAQSVLQSTLTNLLNSTLGGLLNSPLLSLKGISVGLNTKAADTVANSLAGVTAKIGSIKVGALDLGGIDLGAAATQVSTLVNSVNSQLSQVLSVVDPSLGNLVKLGIFSQDKSVNEAGGYTHALASLSALSLKLVPPAALSGLVRGLLQPTGILGTVGASSVSSLLMGPGAASSVPVLGSLMQSANGLLPGAGGLGVLANGVSADILKVASTSDFALVGAAAAPAPVSELPMTGGNHMFFLVGLLLLASGAVLVRFVRVSRSEA